MRAERRWLLTLLLAAAPAWGAEAPPDSVTPRVVPVLPPPASVPADTTVARPPEPPEPASADTVRAARRGIDLTGARKRGANSLEDALPFRRAVLLNPLPFSGPTQGSLHTPDAGGPIRLQGWLHEAETTTDEHWIGSVALGWGAPWLAFALDDPRADAIEALDLGAVEFAESPLPLRAPGEALADLVPRGPAFASALPDTGRPNASRTTLVYRRGSGDAQLTGARFQTRVFRRGLYASFSRNQANGWSPLRESLTKRYALRAELGKVAAHRFEVEGLLFERAIEDSTEATSGDGTFGGSEWDRHALALRASRDGARGSDSWRLGIDRDKKTWLATRDFNVSPDAGARERWEFPSLSGQGRVALRTGSLTGIGWIDLASTRIVYRADSLPAFRPRRGEARGGMGARFALGASAGLGLDAAYDARQDQPGFLDGRATLWGGTDRARGRLDLESAHERPTWMDLFTPPTLHSFFSPGIAIPTQLGRSGDPTLRPRTLRGGLGFLDLTLGRGLDLELSGSYRRVTDDFGWDVTTDTTGGFLTVRSFARRRGDGWLSHAAIGWDLRRGPLRARGAAWVRGGADSLSPRAGSPARRAVDAALEARVILFQGDLPLTFGVESHARGPRRGLIREAGQITWDGTLSADFGPAGAFVRLQDIFDRRPGSAIWDPVVPSGAPMPGRTFQAGVVWNLLD